jgi:hypothetical protein
MIQLTLKNLPFYDSTSPCKTTSKAAKTTVSPVLIFPFSQAFNIGIARITYF